MELVDFLYRYSSISVDELFVDFLDDIFEEYYLDYFFKINNIYNLDLPTLKSIEYAITKFEESIFIEYLFNNQNNLINHEEKIELIDQKKKIIYKKIKSSIDCLTNSKDKICIMKCLINYDDLLNYLFFLNEQDDKTDLEDYLLIIFTRNEFTDIKIYFLNNLKKIIVYNKSKLTITSSMFFEIIKNRPDFFNKEHLKLFIFDIEMLFLSKYTTEIYFNNLNNLEINKKLKEICYNLPLAKGIEISEIDELMNSLESNLSNLNFHQHRWLVEKYIIESTKQ